MRNKRLLRTLSAFCLTMVVAFGFTIPAFAQGSEQAPVAPAEDSTNFLCAICAEWLCVLYLGGPSGVYRKMHPQSKASRKERNIS